jgi:hypothetical protein
MVRERLARLACRGSVKWTRHTEPRHTYPVAPTYSALLAREISRRRGNRSVAEVAGQAHVSVRRWHQLEKGWEVRNGQESPSTPGQKIVVQIARALRWNPNDAIRVANEDRKTLGKEPLDLVDDTEEVIPPSVDLPDEIVKLWPQLSIEQRHALVGVARTMADRNAAAFDVQFPPVRHPATHLAFLPGSGAVHTGDVPARRP